MKRCPRCDRTHPETDTQCPYCQYKEEEPAQVASHIDFLLGEIPQWVNRSWLDRDKASLLSDIYTRRRNSLRPPTAPSAPLVATRPQLVVQHRPEETPTPVARRAHPMAEFLEERNISYWHLVGAVLLLAGLSGLVRYTWDTAGKYLVFVLMIAVTAGFYALGRTLTRQNHITTGWALRAVAMLLVPLDLIAINAFALQSLHLSVNTIGLLTAGLCLPLYAWRAARERLRCFDILLTLAVAATLHFGLQTVLPHVIASRSPLAIYAAYGFFYLPVALVYFVAARLAAPERRMTWIVSAHAMALGSVILAVWPSGGRTLGDSSATLLLAAALYAATTFLLDSALYSWLASLLACVGLTLAISRHGSPAWYWYAILAQVVAFASTALSRLHSAGSRNEAAAGFRASGWVLAILSFTIQIGALFTGFEYFPNFAVPRPDLYGAAACALLSTGYILWLVKPAVIAPFVAYLFVVVGLILARMLPHGVAWHDTPQVGLPLAFASVVFVFVEPNRRRSATIIAMVSLVACCIYAVTGNAFGFTLFTLALLAAVMGVSSIKIASDEGPIERQAMLWTTTGSVVAGILLWETRLLPFLHAQLHMEKNYGYGLILLIALSVAHGAYWRARNERTEDGLAPYQIAGVISVIGIAIQLGDSVTGLPFSPLVLLGVGVIASGLFAARFRSLIAAGSTVALVAIAYFAYLLYLGSVGVSTLFSHPLPFAGPQTDHIREGMIIAILLLSSALLVAIAARMRMRPFIAFAVLAGVGGVLSAVHLALHPVEVVYSLALLAIGILLAVAAYRRPRAASDLWHKPLRDMSLVASLFAVLLAVAPHISASSGPLDTRALWCLLGCGLLWACLAVASGELYYVYLSAFAFSGAYLYGLFQHIHSTGVIGFDLAIGAFAWSAASILFALTTRIREEITLAFHHVATTLIFFALGFALFGDGRNQSELHTLLVAAAVFFASFWRTRAEGWQHAGVAALIWAYFILLTQHVSGITTANSDLYFTPVGAYLIVLGILARRRPRTESPPPPYQLYFVTGLLAVMGPTLVATHESHAQAFRAPLLATECVLAIFYGLTVRMKAFVGCGTAFLIALIAVEAQGSASTFAWAIYATILGLVVIGSALFIERRRDSFTRWTQSVREKIKEWE